VTYNTVITHHVCNRGELFSPWFVCWKQADVFAKRKYKLVYWLVVNS